MDVFEFLIGMLFGVGLGITIMALVIGAKAAEDDALLVHWEEMRRRAEAAGVGQPVMGASASAEWFGVEYHNE